MKAALLRGKPAEGWKNKAVDERLSAARTLKHEPIE
jgi:hypothetical protein